MVIIFFKAIIGLKVNIGKSEIVPMGVVGSLNALASVLGCNIGRLLIVYLGMPFGAHFNDSLIWNPIIEKMEKKLSGWKRLYLVSLAWKA